MKKIAFFNIPAHGHTNPTLNVVRALVDQGIQIRYYSFEPMREKIEETGADFISCEKWNAEFSLKEKDRDKIGKDLFFSSKLLIDTTLSMDEAILSEMKEWKPDCIVADSMAVWGKAIAKKLAIPFVSSTTTFAFNKESAKLMNQGIGTVFSGIVAGIRVGKYLKPLQVKGYPFKTILDLIQNDNDTRTIVYTSSFFQPESQTFSDCYAFVGPSIRPVKERMEKRAQKRVYISMGTVRNNYRTFYENCIEALKEEKDLEVILSVGGEIEPESFGKIPDHIRILKHVDQIGVLEEADAFLTHCGMNSASEGLYFGVPLITHPITQEQGAVAKRSEMLGAGLRLDEEDKKSIQKAVREVLEKDSYREAAETIRESFLAAGGTKKAVEHILSAR